jgi:isopentenyl diphosphate isomerase/L-lactate dehydrogenase-like FMN-dependent dehydrogenase
VDERAGPGDTPEGDVTPEESTAVADRVAPDVAGDDLQRVVNLEGFEPIARTKMDPAGYNYYAGGAADEVTLRENIAAFRRRKLRPRVLVDVSSIDPSTEVLGQRVAIPVGLAPTGLNGLAHPEGEAAAARAAARRETLFCISTLSSSSLEEAAAAGGPRWFQLYVNEDRALSEALVKRARDAGYSALVLTVDLPVVGYRERELSTPMRLSDQRVGNFDALMREAGDLPHVFTTLFDQTLSWRDVEWVRNASGMPLVIKGIMTAEDALLAVEHGADAVLVSNHGGRQLDRVPASIDVLEEVVDAVGDRAEVYLDGGVRRGADVMTALALGARAVFIGRPYLYALAAGGEAGVVRCLELVTAEIENAMALLGVRDVNEVSRAHTY